MFTGDTLLHAFYPNKLDHVIPLVMLVVNIVVKVSFTEIAVNVSNSIYAIL